MNLYLVVTRSVGGWEAASAVVRASNSNNARRVLGMEKGIVTDQAWLDPERTTVTRLATDVEGGVGVVLDNYRAAQR